MSKQMLELAEELENIRKRGHFPNDSLIEDVVAALRSSAESETPVAWRVYCTNNAATGYVYTEVQEFHPGHGITVRREPEPLYTRPAPSASVREALERVVQHDPRNPSLHYDTIEGLLASAADAAKDAFIALSGRAPADVLPQTARPPVDITGWKLMPDEPTEAMWQAGREADINPRDSYSKVWRAMWQAAPEIEDCETRSQARANNER